MDPDRRGTAAASAVPAVLVVGYLVITGVLAMGLGGFVGHITGDRITGAPRFVPPVAVAIGFSAAGGWVALPLLRRVVGTIHSVHADH